MYVALQIQCPRLSYIPFLLPRIHAFFASALINPDVRPSDGWLSCQDVPLKWHLPVGLLYDLYSGAEPAYAPGRGVGGSMGRRGVEQGGDVVRSGDREDGGNEDGEGEEGMGEGKLPWRLVVHFTEWPDEQLVRLDGEGRILHDAFINSVKEVRFKRNVIILGDLLHLPAGAATDTSTPQQADFLRNGTAKTVMSLSKDDSTRLWEAVEQRTSSSRHPFPLLYSSTIRTQMHTDHTHVQRANRQPPLLQHNQSKTAQPARRPSPPHPHQNLPPQQILLRQRKLNPSTRLLARRAVPRHTLPPITYVFQQP